MTVNYTSKRKPKYDGVFSFGNSKLPYSTAIFNMTAATDCPSAKLGLCAAVINGKNHCYALKPERLFPKSSLRYKRRQAEYWSKVTTMQFVADLISTRYFNQCKVLRFNESGDFRTQNDISKADKIAGLLKKYKIKVYMYTSRHDLRYDRVKYITIMGSGFIKKGIKAEFKIIRRKADIPAGYKLCPMDCSRCKRCQLGKNTAVLLH